MAALGSIKRIFVLMLENRSFDHMLGYLSLKGALPVNGLRHPLDPHTNTYNGQPYPLFPLTSLRVPDPLHDRQHIRIQIDGGSMHGFVASYAINHAVSRDLPPPVMGYYTEAEVPITDFFARQFAVCDSWFAPFPTGTQPNRLMAMAGYSLIGDNEEPLPHHDLVYDWLTRSGVPWCVYHEEFPLFMMMHEWIPHIVMDGTHFRRLSDLPKDILNDDLPQVVFIEPTYTDAPHYKEPSDAHPPSSISHSENFLRNVYLALVTADLWKDCVLIVTYDEHGGFFDHEPPRPLPTPIPRDAEYGDQFMTTGLRVPALIVSPFVSAGRVYSDLLDHTSILKFLAERFRNTANGGQYSPVVEARPVGNLVAVFNCLDAPRLDPPAPPPPPEYPLEATTIQRAFQAGVERMVKMYPSQAEVKFPELRLIGP